MSNLVALTLNSLKAILGDQKELTVQQEEGYLLQAQFVFNLPAELQQIEQFCQEHQWNLPIDYMDFLLLHNGARLYASDSDRGFELFSLEEIVENHLEDMPDEYIPIGNLWGDYLFIDSLRASDHPASYLIWHGSCESFKEPTLRFRINFSTWLDRYVMAQGSKYWLWYN